MGEQINRDGGRRNAVDFGALRSAVRRSSVPEVIELLQQADIRDLEGLVRHTIDKAEAEPGLLDVFAPVGEPLPAEAYKHRAPAVPFTVGGVTYDPADVGRLDGRSLHFVLRPKGDPNAPEPEYELLGFVGDDWLRATTAQLQMRKFALSVGSGVHVQTHQSGHYHCPPGWDCYVQPILPPTTTVPSLIARFYEHASFQGDRFRLDGNRTVADLTQFSRGFLGLGDWNDVISSIQSDGATLVLYEHVHFQGDSLIVMPTDLVRNLADFGFNDRVSSIQNFGQIY